MKRRPKKVPQPVRVCLWYADPRGLDWERNKSQIITSVLNYGSLDALRWLFRFYRAPDIKQAIAHPKRGQWFPHSLNFWSQYFRIKIAPKTYERALFRLHPAEAIHRAPRRALR